MPKKQKILIIDDIPENVYALKDRLEKEGYAVLGVTDGKTGISVALAELPDLIFCDIMMPQLNGYEVMKILKGNPHTAFIPFIFLTAKSETEEIREGMQLGADDYLVKPFSSEDIIKVVKVRLEKKKAFDKKLTSLKESISYSLPHELQTPLTTILGFSDILVEDYESIPKDQLKEIAQNIKGSAERLKTIIQKFLVIVRLDAILLDNEEMSKMKKIGSVPAKESVERYAKKIAKLYKREKDLNLEIEDAVIKIPDSYLSSIIEEIVDNAFKFSAKSSQVSVIGELDAQNYIIYVIDNGRGMSKDEIASVSEFMQFKRMNFEQPGTGLGLSIAKKITEIFDGSFLIESIPSKQTMIKITFPVNGLTE